MDENRAALRHPLQGEQVYSLGIITYKHLKWIDHTVRLVDLSKSGIGIVSEQPMGPGFVWFNDRVRGHKGGVLVWCRKLDDKYRAGIRFVTLSADEERFVQEKTAPSGHRPVRNPEEIIAALMGSIIRSNDRY